ncbi:uncharacterized protein IUM83_03516 [Phytophthora cinnamomi]|uniref:uncharacterized protein n=1 Tax=Phytophthora cinnamomi TaxID=4785 RepID=UPI0035599611|nr:hypothetical protein IUM83_03516 [Phytophthora cinnamomi]
MTPKISRDLGFKEHYEQHHKSSSILAGVEDFLDDEDWDMKPRRRSSSVEATLGSWFTSLASGLHSVRFAVTTRAKRLYARDSTRRGGQLRNSMVEISSAQAGRSLARANSMPAPFLRSSESDLDLFGGVEDDEPDAENLAEVYLLKLPSPSPRRSSTPGTGAFSRLLPTRSWTQGSK